MVCAKPSSGLAKVKAQTVFTLNGLTTTRMATLFGWRLSATWGEIRLRTERRRRAAKPKSQRNRLKSGFQGLQRECGRIFCIVSNEQPEGIAVFWATCWEDV